MNCRSNNCYINASLVIYTGVDLPKINVFTRDRLDTILGKLNGVAGTYVKSINNVKPDSSGNITLDVSGSSGETDPVFTTWLDSNPLSVYTPVSRQITINGTSFDLSANRSWTITPGIWGQITGTIANQTDLISLLDTYQPLITTGTALQYLKGNLSLGTFPTNVSSFTNDSGYITSETDPVWLSDKVNYYTKIQSDARYLQSFTETDPVFSAWLATPPNISTFTNDSGYITSAALSPYLLSATAGTTYTPLTRTITINGTPLDLSANRSWSVGTVTSVGLSMPSAFTVTSSPVTGSGTLTVTGAGTTLQYIRGDGTLATFPTASNPSFEDTLTTQGVTALGADHTVDFGTHNLRFSNIKMGINTAATTDDLTIGGNSSLVGNVGIGTGSQGEKLFVNGSSRLDGAVRIDGATTFASYTGAADGLMGLTTGGIGSNVQIGSGLTLSAGTLSNGSPDQTVSLTSGTGISVTGTYPNFTITNSSPASSLAFSTGLTNSGGTITSNLSTGVSGGQSVIGGTGAGENLTLSSTSNVTKGKIFFGANSAYDGVNTRLGIGVTSPSAFLHIQGTTEQLRVAYDASNYASITIDSSAGCSFDLSNSGSNFTFNETVMLLKGFQSNLSNVASNFAVTSASSAIQNITAASLTFAGASQISARRLMKGGTNPTLTVGNSYGGTIFGKESVTAAASGTHSLIANVVIKPVDITTGASTITNAASLYIENTPTGATNNYSLWIALGMARFDGRLLVPQYTTTQRDALTGVQAGEIIYNTTLNAHQGWNGTTWNSFY